APGSSSTYHPGRLWRRKSVPTLGASTLRLVGDPGVPPGRPVEPPPAERLQFRGDAFGGFLQNQLGFPLRLASFARDGETGHLGAQRGSELVPVVARNPPGAH